MVRELEMFAGQRCHLLETAAESLCRGRRSWHLTQRCGQSPSPFHRSRAMPTAELWCRMHPWGGDVQWHQTRSPSAKVFNSAGKKVICAFLDSWTADSCTGNQSYSGCLTPGAGRGILLWKVLGKSNLRPGESFSPSLPCFVPLSWWQTTQVQQEQMKGCPPQSSPFSQKRW